MGAPYIVHFAMCGPRATSAIPASLSTMPATSDGGRSASVDSSATAKQGWILLLAGNRLSLWLLELLAQALLIGAVLTVYSTLPTFQEMLPWEKPESAFASGMLVLFLLTAGTLLMFGVSGYVVTTGIVRLLMKPTKGFRIPLICASLALVHLYAELRFGSQPPPEGAEKALFLVSVPLIVFLCTSIGDHLWRKANGLKG